ncbi:hypothetical protein BT96DRAFT_690378, partial [Gymnopus androsaceus JB14]
MNTQTHPEQLTGGCLCESIRYTVRFSEEYPYPPDPHTCQCTTCRKQSGALIVHSVTVSTSQLSWTTAPPAEFPSSPGFFRGFCPKCGSALTYRAVEPAPDNVELLAETFDEDVLKGPWAVGLTKPIGGQFW